MATNWSAEHHDCLTQTERAAERRPTPDRVATGAFPAHCLHRKVEGFIAGSAPSSTGAVLVPHRIFFAHIIWAAGKKVANWICENCGPVRLFRATPRKQ